MRILLDIGHPAHVHYFKNFYAIMMGKGHEFLITARKKEVSQELLEAYDMPYVNRGTGSNKTMGKALYLPKANYLIIVEALKFKPDLFLSFGSPYAAQVSFFLGKPHISFDDTENAKFAHKLYRPFTKQIFSPSAYKGEKTNKQEFFNGYMELSYLSPKYFSPDPNVLEFINIQPQEKFVILRFVSWGATHDAGHSGVSEANKIKLVKEMSKHAKVFISSEAELNGPLKSYQIKIPPDKMHDILYYSTLFFGESATMASESAILGTYAIYLDDEGRGYTDELEKEYSLVENYTESTEDQEKAIGRAIELLTNDNLKAESIHKSKRLISEKIDVTDFMVRKIEEFI